MANKTKETKNPFLAIILVLASLTFAVNADISLNIDFTVEKSFSRNDADNQYDKSKENYSIDNYKLRLNAGANSDGNVNIVKDSK